MQRKFIHLHAHQHEQKRNTTCQMVHWWEVPKPNGVAGISTPNRELISLPDGKPGG